MESTDRSRQETISTTVITETATDLWDVPLFLSPNVFSLSFSKHFDQQADNLPFLSSLDINFELTTNDQLVPPTKLHPVSTSPFFPACDIDLAIEWIGSEEKSLVPMYDSVHSDGTFTSIKNSSHKMITENTHSNNYIFKQEPVESLYCTIFKPTQILTSDRKLPQNIHTAVENSKVTYSLNSTEPSWSNGDLSENNIDLRFFESFLNDTPSSVTSSIKHYKSPQILKQLNETITQIFKPIPLAISRSTCLTFLHLLSFISCQCIFLQLSSK